MLLLSICNPVSSQNFLFPAQNTFSHFSIYTTIIHGFNGFV